MKEMSRPAEPRRSNKLVEKKASHSKINKKIPMNESMVSIRSLEESAWGKANRGPRAQMLNSNMEESIRRLRSLKKPAADATTPRSPRKQSIKTDTISLSDSMPSIHNDPHIMDALGLNDAMSSTQSAPSAANGSNIQHSSYSGVILNKIVGSLTLTEDRLIFKPQARRDRKHTFAWPLDSLQRHQISAPPGPCFLKLISQSNPSKAVTMKFPHRTLLEDIHADLTHKLQPTMRKYRRIQETLVKTQRKLKEAKHTIDDLQDTNERLLESCEAFAKKCKRLSDELQQQQRKAIQRHVANDKVTELEQQLLAMRPELEALRNHNTALTIGHEMDVEGYVQGYEERIRKLEEELAEERMALNEERETTERLLEDREPLDELQLEVHVLAKDLLSARRMERDTKESMEQQEREMEDMLGQVRRQRNNVLLELAHVKLERDKLQYQLDRYQEVGEKQNPTATKQQSADADGEEDDDSVLGLDCLTVSTGDEEWKFLTKANKSTTVSNQHAWAGLRGYLPLLLLANRPLLRSPFGLPHGSSTVVPWQGVAVVAHLCEPQDRTGRDGGGPQKALQPRGAMYCAVLPFRCNSSAMSMDNAFWKNDTNHHHPTPSAFTDKYCLASTTARAALSHYPAEYWVDQSWFEPPSTSRSRVHDTMAIQTFVHDDPLAKYLVDHSRCELSSTSRSLGQSSIYSGWDDNPMWAWSRYLNLPNAVVVSIESSPGGWGWKLATEGTWPRQQPKQLCLPDNTPVGRTHPDQ